MARVSKQTLQERQPQKLFGHMDAIISKQTLKNTTAFLDELLGDEERIMLVKRFAIIAMCTDGRSLYFISQNLKVSPSTAERIRNEYRHGKYSRIESIIKKDAHRIEEFFRTLEVVLRAGLPPRVGKNRAYLWFQKRPQSKPYDRS